MEKTNELSEIDLREVFVVLRRRAWLIITVPLVAAIIAGMWSVYVLKPTYRASTTLWVIKQESTIDYTTLLTNRNLVKTYAEVAHSRVVMEEVIDTLDLGISPDGLQNKLSVNPVRDTEIIELSITDGNPAQAARIADAVALSFMTQLRNYLELENVAVVDHAATPTSPIRPRPVMNIAIAGVLGTMAALGLAFVLEYMDTSITSVDDMVRTLGVPALASIPHVDLRRQRLKAAARQARLKERADSRPTASEGEVPVAE